MVRVHVPGAAPPVVELPEGERHHVGRVLRLRPGDALIVFDGRGREWLGRLATLSRTEATVELTSSRTPLPEPAVAVTLGVGLLKGDQMDDVVRNATMLGVTAVVPCLSAFVALSDRARERRSRDRWTRIAIASAKQCARAVIPAIEAPLPLSSILASAELGAVICCAEPGRTAAVPLAQIRRPERALLLVGPEGGWSEGELAECAARGAQFLELGPRTLRAETAPTVALSALWTVWGWS